MLLLPPIWLVCFSLSLTHATPVVSPPGFNASEDAEAVVFKCEVTDDTVEAKWLINGTSTSNLTLEDHRRIFWNETVMTENEATYMYIEISIHPIAENDGTCLQCCVKYSNGGIEMSNKALFQVQGLLSPPTNLSIVMSNFTHDHLVWEDPPTLDLTDQDPDITGYTVSMLKPSPSSFTDPDLVDYCEYNFSVSLTSGRQFPVLRYGFPVLRHCFPVRFRVSAWNPAGQGKTSQYRMIEPPSDYMYMRIEDHSFQGTESTVTYNKSSLCLEILLLQIPGNFYCFDYLTVKINDSHDGTLCSQHNLLPTVRGNDVVLSMKVESCVEKHGPFIALVYSNSSLLTQTMFSLPQDDNTAEQTSPTTIIGGVLFVVVLILLLGVSAVFAWVVLKKYRKKRHFQEPVIYSVAKYEGASFVGGCSPSNPVSENDYESRYSVSPKSTLPFEDPKYEVKKTKPQKEEKSEPLFEDPGYEIIHSDKKRVQRREASKTAVTATTQQKEEEIAGHTYSTVNKVHSSKKTWSQDSPPPPLPPQTFTEDYAQELLRFSQLSDEKNVSSTPDVAGQQTHQMEDGCHIYDLIHPSATLTHSQSHTDVQSILPQQPPRAMTT